MKNHSQYPEISILLLNYEYDSIYKYDLCIKNAIKSILDQTITAFELLIISESNNSEKIRKILLLFNDKRISHIIVKEREHFCAYEGIKQAKGKYICFANPYVACMKDRLEIQIAHMEENDTIDISGICLSSYLSNMELIKVMQLCGPVLYWPSIIIKQSVLQEYELLFKKKMHMSAICHQLEKNILNKNEKAFSILNTAIFSYKLEFPSDSTNFDPSCVDQIKSIKNQKNGHYDPDFLSGLLDSIPCSRTRHPMNTRTSKRTQVSDTIRILVICPHLEVINPFVSILIREINSKEYAVNYGIDVFWAMKEDYDIIHIHWPEMFFRWRPPVDNDVERLSDCLRKWKQKGTKIIYTRHDEDYHYSTNKPVTKKMFDLIKRESDAIVHLGEYSKRETMKELNISEQINAVIPHHIYDTIYNNNIEKAFARDILNIDKNCIVILAFGYFRDREENLLVKEAFEQLDVENKFLLAPSWENNEIIPEGNVFLGDGKVDENMLPFCFAAADIVLIQRLKILNSGNLPMAFFFNKVVVGPDTGNIGEYLDEDTNFSFDCNETSTASEALYKAVARINSGKPVNNEKFVRENWRTAQIVEQYRSLYQSIASIRQ